MSQLAGRPVAFECDDTEPRAASGSGMLDSDGVRSSKRDNEPSAVGGNIKKVRRRVVAVAIRLSVLINERCFLADAES